MPSQQTDILSRIKLVEREYSAVRLAINRLLESVLVNPSKLLPELRVRDIQNAFDHLEDTYFIRLFAEFEHALRDFWKTVRSTDPPAKDLIYSIGAKQNISDAWIGDVQHVREYRNQLVHMGGEEVAAISIQTARRALCCFLSRLPREW